MARLIRFATLAATPWKNGAGSTTEIALFPADAGYDNFDWRVSLATIARSGPFSIFPGIDRTLVLLTGAGLTLDLHDGAPRLLTAAAPAFSFAGEATVHASITGAAGTDFNIMTRRARCAHRLTRQPVSGAGHVTRTSPTTLLFLAHGEALTVSEHQLNRCDAVLLTAADPARLTLSAATPSELFVIDLLEQTT